MGVHALVVVTLLGAACSFHDAPGGVVGDGGPSPTGDAAPRDAIADANLDATVDAPNVMGAPRLVQQAQGVRQSGSPQSATFGTAPSTGDVLIMVGAAEHGALASVTGGGATWTRATSSLTNENIEIWFGTTDGSSSTVTVTFAGSNPYPMWLVISEWSGIATTNTLDVATSRSGTSANASAGTITTTNAHDVIVFGVADQSPNTWGTPGAGWQTMQQVAATGVTQGTWYMVAATTGSFVPQVTQTANSWDAAIASFRAAQ